MHWVSCSPGSSPIRLRFYIRIRHYPINVQRKFDENPARSHLVLAGVGSDGRVARRSFDLATHMNPTFPIRQSKHSWADCSPGGSPIAPKFCIQSR